MSADLARVTSPNFDQIQLRDSSDATQFAALLMGTGMQLKAIDSTRPFSITALRAPGFISAWANVPAASFVVPRGGRHISSRTLFVFVNSGQTLVEVEDRSVQLARGEVVAISPGTSPVSLASTAERNENILFSIDLPIDAGGIEGVTGDPITRLTDPSLNTFAFAACYGLAQAPVPASGAIGDTLHHVAATLARSLIERVSTTHEPDLYCSASRYIRLHAADPELTSVTVAARFHVSPRKLQLHFSAADDTVVWAIRRSRASIAQLLWQQDATLSAADVANRSGFPSPRAMRKALLEAPRATEGEAVIGLPSE